MEKDERGWFSVDWATGSIGPGWPTRPGGKLGREELRSSGEGSGDVRLGGEADRQRAGGLSMWRSRRLTVPVVGKPDGAGLSTVSINPRQADRFRDRFSPAGAKDDSRDAQVLADALRTDPRAFRALIAADPVMIELARVVQDARGAAWRADPTGQPPPRPAVALLAGVIALAGGDIAADWFIELITLAPTPEQPGGCDRSAVPGC